MSQPTAPAAAAAAAFKRDNPGMPEVKAPAASAPAAKTPEVDRLPAAKRTDPKPDAPKVEDPKVKADAEAKAKADAEELAFLGAPVILSPELVKETAPQNARNDRQVKMDETVKRLHEAWTNANGPSTWGAAVNAKVVATYFVEPEKAEDIKKLVTKAGRFHGVTIRWGTSFLATADLVKKHNLPENYTGREVLSFFVKTTRTVAKNGQGGNRTAAKPDTDTKPEAKAGDITPKP